MHFPELSRLGLGYPWTDCDYYGYCYDSYFCCDYGRVDASSNFLKWGDSKLDIQTHGKSCKALDLSALAVTFAGLGVEHSDLLYLPSKAQSEFRNLKKKIDTFDEVVAVLEKDIKLQKVYYDKKILYQNEFGRDSVENIDQLLQTLYESDAFFELTSLSITQKNKNADAETSKIDFLVDGTKRLVKK